MARRETVALIFHADVALAEQVRELARLARCRSYPVATVARSHHARSRAHALERAVDGRWVMIEAAHLEGGADEGRIAVTLRAAGPAETFDLLSGVYELTQRERDVVGAVLAGLDTRAVTERLFITRHTVQDHLKSVFTKTGVHSRRELLATFNASADDMGRDSSFVAAAESP